MKNTDGIAQLRLRLDRTRAFEAAAVDERVQAAHRVMIEALEGHIAHLEGAASRVGQ